MHYTIRYCLILIIAIVYQSFAGSNDTLPADTDHTVVVKAPKLYSPIRVGGYSALLPGAGQVYTGHYIKGSAFVAMEAITASIAHFWFVEYNNRISIEHATFSTAPLARTWIDSMYVLEEAHLHHHDAKSARYSMYNALSWMVGGYVYNVCDAIKSSGYFNSESERNARTAGLLSAIPGFGLGQIYNGEISKAGMIMMTQASLAVIAINEQRLMSQAQKNYNRAFAIKDSSGASPVGQKFKAEWDSREQNAFKNRNSYLWYSLFFYFYGILDAVVDAHLHDYEQKMRTYPDLDPKQGSIGINFEYQF